jgi:hypothetical protein
MHTPAAIRARSQSLSLLARSVLLLALLALGLATGGLGAVSITTPAGATFAVTLSGTDQTATYLLPFTVDSNKTDGWNVSASATQFTTGTRTFPADGSSVVAVTPPPASACTGSCLLPAPTGSVVYPVTLPNTGGVSIYNAAIGSGRGTLTMTATVQVRTPANVYAGTYTSTVTLQVVIGP